MKTRKNFDLVWDFYRASQRLGVLRATLEDAHTVSEFVDQFKECQRLMSQVLAIMEQNGKGQNV
jgi:hypothetical protein